MTVAVIDKKADYKKVLENSTPGADLTKTAAETDSKLNPKGKKVVVLDAFATWCGPCKAIAPKIEGYSEKYKDAHFIQVDVDESPDIAQELGIRAMPTFLVYKNGEEVAKIIGAYPDKLEAAIAEAVAA